MKEGTEVQERRLLLQRRRRKTLARKRKAGAYIDPAIAKMKKRKAPEAGRGEVKQGKEASSIIESRGSGSDVRTRRSVRARSGRRAPLPSRKSSRSATAKKVADSTRRREMKRKKMKMIGKRDAKAKRKKIVPQKLYTQEELLLIAAQTEQDNRLALERWRQVRERERERERGREGGREGGRERELIACARRAIPPPILILLIFFLYSLVLCSRIQGNYNARSTPEIAATGSSSCSTEAR